MSAADDFPNLVGGPQGNAAIVEIDRLREENAVLHARVEWHEKPAHGCNGCKHERSEDGTFTWTINDDCLYHRWAAEHPRDHRSPWNCPTYWDGCNCKATLQQLDPQVRREMQALAEDWLLSRNAAATYEENERLEDEIARLRPLVEAAKAYLAAYLAVVDVPIEDAEGTLLAAVRAYEEGTT